MGSISTELKTKLHKTFKTLLPPAGPYLGFEFNFRFLEMPYFGRQVGTAESSTTPWKPKLCRVSKLPLT